MYSFELITPPDGAVIPVAELRQHLKFLGTDRDDEITAQESAAVEQLQEDLRRQFLTATWKMHLSGFPSAIIIPKCPVQEISSISYVSSSGSEETLSEATYLADLTTEPACILPSYGHCWPVSRAQLKAVTVTFVAGYGEAEDVPALIKHTLKLIVEGFFQGNENELAATIERLSQRLKYQML